MRLLWIGDGGVPTGFSTVSHAILGELVNRGYDVHHLAVCHNGDPMPNVPWPMYPAQTRQSNIYGHERVAGLVQRLNPDVVCILNDPWVVATYQEVLKDQKVLAYMPVDGQNQWSARKLNWLRRGIAYTVFGARELRRGGFTSPIDVIPHGIDTEVFRPVPRGDARAALNFADDDKAAFIVGNVNRNQVRKRLDLTLYAFAEFARSLPKEENVRLLLHCALIDAGWELIDLCRYLGIERYLLFTGIKNVNDYTQFSTVDRLRNIYNAMNVHVSTSMAEGWGLTSMESMACGTLTVLPWHSALAEWAAGGAIFYPANDPHVEINGLNTIQRVPDWRELASILGTLYAGSTSAPPYAEAGKALVSQSEYRWKNVAKQFDVAFQEAR